MSNFIKVDYKFLMLLNVILVLVIVEEQTLMPEDNSFGMHRSTGCLEQGLFFVHPALRSSHTAHSLASMFIGIHESSKKIGLELGCGIY